MQITSITHFAVENVERRDARIDHVTKVTLSIESTTSGRHSLVLIEPFPPFGRAGKHLAKLESLQREIIESVWVFPASDDVTCPKDARIEITATAGEMAIFRCKEIKGLLDDNDGVTQSPTGQIAHNLEKST